MKLTRKQKYLALSMCPTADGECTWDEVRAWRKTLAGTIHRETNFYCFVAFNSRGHRKQVEYCHGPRERKRVGCDCVSDYVNAKKEAYNWAGRR